MQFVMRTTSRRRKTGKLCFAKKNGHKKHGINNNQTYGYAFMGQRRTRFFRSFLWPFFFAKHSFPVFLLREVVRITNCILPSFLWPFFFAKHSFPVSLLREVLVCVLDCVFSWTNQRFGSGFV